MALQVEREAREGVIELLHKEVMKWMDETTHMIMLNISMEIPVIFLLKREGGRLNN